MKHKTKNVLIAAMAVLFIAVIVNQTGYLGPRIDWSRLSLVEEEEEEPTGPTGPTTPSVTTGIVTSDVAGFDSLDISTSRTIGTNVNVYWYAKRSGQWVLLGSGDAADLNIEKADANTIYCIMQVPSGQNFYIDYNKILSMNTRLNAVDYADIDGDSLEEFIFTMDVSSIPYASGTGKYSMPSVNVYLLTYDSSWAFPNAGQPADITGLGTSTNRTYLEWYTEMSAEKKAVALSKVVLQANTSDISKVTLKKLNIPGIGYLDGSSFDQDVLTSSIKWTYDISSLLYGADYLQVPSNTLNKQEYTTCVDFDLASGDVIRMTLYLYYLDNVESQQSINDYVDCSA